MTSAISVAYSVYIYFKVEMRGLQETWIKDCCVFFSGHLSGFKASTKSDLVQCLYYLSGDFGRRSCFKKMSQIYALSYAKS